LEFKRANATISIGQISERFGVRRIIEGMKDRTFFASLLYYMGALTQTESPYPAEIGLRIPNLVMKRLYVEEIREALLPDSEGMGLTDAARTLYMQGDIAPLCQLLQERVFAAFSNRDYRWSNETTLKAAFLTALFNDRLFIMDSEDEIGRHYTDLTIIVRPGMRHFDVFDVLLELKFIPLSKLQMTDDETLLAIPAVQQAFAQAQAQIDIYDPLLHEKYGEGMKLRSIAVVALGFDRLLWNASTTQS